MQEVMTIERWASLIWKAAGHESSVRFVPGDVVRRSLQEYSVPLSRPLPYIHDLSKAERDFGFATTPVRDWIQTTVDWYREHYEREASQGYERRGDEIELAKSWGGAYDKLIAEFGAPPVSP